MSDNNINRTKGRHSHGFKEHYIIKEEREQYLNQPSPQEKWLRNCSKTLASFNKNRKLFDGLRAGDKVKVLMTDPPVQAEVIGFLFTTNDGIILRTDAGEVFNWFSFLVNIIERCST